MSIIEQIKHLKELSDTARANVYSFEALGQSLREAADTIESLSAKLQAANMGNVNDDFVSRREILDRIYDFIEKHRYDDEVQWAGDEWWLKKDSIINIIENMEQTAVDCVGGWIPCKDRLPEEKINPITQDFYEYQVTFKSGDVADIRHYKFGKGHWWNGPGIMDKYVIAWRQNIETYREP